MINSASLMDIFLLCLGIYQDFHFILCYLGQAPLVLTRKIIHCLRVLIPQQSPPIEMVLTSCRGEWFSSRLF